MSEQRPGLSPEMLIVLAGLEANRERRGAKWCGRNGVGAIRLRIDREPVPTIIDVDSYRAAHRVATTALRTVCRACKGCKMAER